MILALLRVRFSCVQSKFVLTVTVPKFIVLVDFSLGGPSLQGGDTDTNAAIVGALLGTRDGTTAIPNNWLRDVRGASPTRRPNWLHASVGAQFLG